MKQLVKVLFFNFCALQFSYGQNKDFLHFTILDKKERKSVPLILLEVKESSGGIFRQPCNLDGNITYKLLSLKADSGYLVLSFATDTLFSCVVYKNRTYQMDTTLYIESKLIKNTKFYSKEGKKQKLY